MTTAKQNKKFPFHFFFRFAAEGWGRRRKENARKFFGLCTRESASVSEAHCLASPRNRSVRFSFKPPRAPRVRSGFAQRLIHHRQNSEFKFPPKIWSARSAVCSAFPPKNSESERIFHAPRGSKSTVRSLI